MSTTTDTAASSPVPTSALEVRERLVEALELDLIGPPPGHELAEERLPGWVRPSVWYLTGFLVPVDAPAEERRDVDADDTLGVAPESEGLAEESAGEEATTAKKGFFPSSLGLVRSFLPPPASFPLPSCGATTSTSPARHVPRRMSGTTASSRPSGSGSLVSGG